MHTAIAPALAALLLLTACAASVAPPAAPTVALEGPVWTLRGFEGQPASPRPVSLRFEAGTVSGRGPCNAVSGTYTRDGEGLRFGPLATSKMYCADASTLEEAYFAALRGVDRATLDGGALILSGGGVRLEYLGGPRP